MNSEELDRWLDADLSAQQDHDGRDDGWAASGDRDRLAVKRATGRGAGARRSWRWIAAAGLVGWLAVMAVAAGGNEEATSQADEGGTEEAGPAGFVDAVPTAANTSLAESEMPAPVATGPASQTLAATGPATAALRARLTTSDPDGASYLEWASVVDVIRLGAGIDLVVIDAIWLEGEDSAALDQVRQARWAVPVADNGEVLASPWPHSPTPEQTREGTAPPAGTVRIGEVGQALTAAGWTGTTVIGSDPHPLLDGGVTALVEGVPPGGGDVATEVVWLQEDADGLLQVPGSAITSDGLTAADPEPTSAAANQKTGAGAVR